MRQLSGRRLSAVPRPNTGRQLFVRRRVLLRAVPPDVVLGAGPAWQSGHQ
jgi:hypothetical protein